jgi:hypothetical protein
MTPNNHRANRLRKWKFFSAVLSGLLLARAVLATDPLYQNDAVLNYTVNFFPASLNYPPPTIDATNFVNNNVFTVIYGTYTFDHEFYEPWNVLNYTNIGSMAVNTGFRFDTQTTNQIPHQMAGSFYNAGTISCGAFAMLPAYAGAGQLVVSATNLASPGEVDIGPNGFLTFTGGNVDLSHSTIGLEGFGSGFFSYPIAIGQDWTFGLDTNADWSPATNLAPTRARSSLFTTYKNPFSLRSLQLDNSTPYWSGQEIATNSFVWRAVFVQDSSPGVSYKVYFSDNTPLGYLGGGADSIQDNIEWTGSYVDPASGTTVNHYLYLDDTTLLNTNLFTANGIPANGIEANFTFYSSPTPVSPTLHGLTGSGFPFGLYTIPQVTNYYSYINAQLVSTTTATNANSANPSGALTNLPGRISVTANGQFNLNLAYITGPNYLSLMGTNQFSGSAGADIVSPFSDISLGTNGPLIITNLLQAALPNWSGTVQAWSGRWMMITSNTVDGINFYAVSNDMRVLLVRSQLTPTTLAQVQHLNLFSRTNQVVISDTFNVMNSLYIDATNLTLTTNGYGGGATSPEGELNLENNAILWPSSLPNLRNLTNNGAIRVSNQAQFINSSRPGVAATGTLSEVLASANVATNNLVAIGAYKYTFVNTITNTVTNQIKIAATFDGSMSNLIAAINRADGAGTNYSTNTLANTFVMAGGLVNHAFTVMARTNGVSGNSIVTTNSAATTNLTWNGRTNLMGGVDYISGATLPYDNFINHGVITDLGATIYANYFENGGTFANNSLGSFNLRSLTAVFTNGSLTAGGDVIITTGSLLTSNLVLQAGRSLTLQATNWFTDCGVFNGNVWTVGGAGLVGLTLPLLPVNPPIPCDLLGTSISVASPSPNKQVTNLWAGLNYGVSNSGYTNNAAVGKLILDATGANSSFAFGGTGTNNAIYVDELDLLHYASYTNHDLAGNLPGLVINTNLVGGMVIYYAQALTMGPGGTMVSVAEKINGKNNNRLRWVASYAGHFSGTNIVYPDGTTNGPFNTALAQSIDIDSDGDGIVNASDPTPFFVSTNFNFMMIGSRVQWTTIPLATNYVFYATNLPATIWLPFTNFDNYYYGADVAFTNSAHLSSFISPQSWMSPPTNVWFYYTGSDTLYFRVMVYPWLTYPF